MTHFPPISLDGRPSKAVEFGRDYRVRYLGVRAHASRELSTTEDLIAPLTGIRFEFVSADYLDFRPKLLYWTPAKGTFLIVFHDVICVSYIVFIYYIIC